MGLGLAWGCYVRRDNPKKTKHGASDAPKPMLEKRFPTFREVCTRCTDFSTQKLTLVVNASSVMR